MITELATGAWIRRNGDNRVVRVVGTEVDDLLIDTYQAHDGALLSRGIIDRTSAEGSFESQGCEFCDPPSWWKRGAVSKGVQS